MKSISFLVPFMCLLSTIGFCQSNPIKSNSSVNDRIFRYANNEDTNNIKRADNPKKKDAVENDEKIDTTNFAGIGPERIKGIQNATVVDIFKVESFTSKDSTAQFLQQYKILETASLQKTDFEAIKTLMLSAKTYDADKAQKLCLFLPKMGIVFSENSKKTEFLISLDCDMVRIYQDDTYVILNSDSGHDSLIALFQKSFPIDIEEEKIEKAPIYYTVQPGDGWSQIAKKATNTYNEKITTDNLLEWNKKSKKDTIHPGDKIVVAFTQK